MSSHWTLEIVPVALDSQLLSPYTKLLQTKTKNFHPVASARVRHLRTWLLYGIYNKNEGTHILFFSVSRLHALSQAQ